MHDGCKRDNIFLWQGGANKAVAVVATALGLVSPALMVQAAISEDAYDLSSDTSVTEADGVKSINESNLTLLFEQKTNSVFYISQSFLIKSTSSTGTHSGNLLFRPGKIFSVGSAQGEQVAQNTTLTFQNGTDVFLVGTSKSTESNGGLAVIAVNGDGGITTSSQYFAVEGYGLVSTPRFEISPYTGASNSAFGTLDGYNAGSTGNITGVPADKFLVFQNQNSRSDAIYSIEDTYLPNKKINQGIYIDTNDLEFILNNRTLQSDTNVQINLASGELAKDYGHF